MFLRTIPARKERLHFKLFPEHFVASFCRARLEEFGHFPGPGGGTRLCSAQSRLHSTQERLNDKATLCRSASIGLFLGNPPIKDRVWGAGGGDSVSAHFVVGCYPLFAIGTTPRGLRGFSFSRGLVAQNWLCGHLPSSAYCCANWRT
jgi:hypothetical protein